MTQRRHGSKLAELTLALLTSLYGISSSITKRVDTEKVVVFWTTPPYVDYVWTVRAGLDQGLVEKISKAFLKLNYENAEDRKLLDLHRTKGYIPAKDEQWKSLEDAAVTTGLINQK